MYHPNRCRGVPHGCLERERKRRETFESTTNTLGRNFHLRSQSIIPSPSRFKRYTRTQSNHMDLKVCANAVLGSNRGAEPIPLIHLIARGRLRGALLNILTRCPAYGLDTGRAQIFLEHAMKMSSGHPIDSRNGFSALILV